ncbi:hypothetical protein DFH08DRAFT_811787 [Mycena albidolilacea]|uniref:Uncharacterized protein n=1 Tax=Mycena albidolilacea TaxID=1033008 RepID=A0AAD7EMI5_9AGAR|nr:hypothetical protein DFH08DRAFT_811787 [Mycena albidolilacea]
MVSTQPIEAIPLNGKCRSHGLEAGHMDVKEDAKKEGANIAQLKLLEGARCGPCLRKDQQNTTAAQPSRRPIGTYDPNQPDPEIKCLHELQAEACRNAMQARTLQKGGSKGSSGSLSLQAAAAKGASRQITVYLVPMTSTGTRTEASQILANVTRSFPEDVLMTDWEKECSESLTPHTALSDSGLVDTHDCVHGGHPKKILQGPSALKLPSPAIYLKGFISVKDCENETGALAPYFVHTARENRKRKTSRTTRTSTSELKRTCSEKPARLPLCSEIGDLPSWQ